jgi:hypothetical protein
MNKNPRSRPTRRRHRNRLMQATSLLTVTGLDLTLGRPADAAATSAHTVSAAGSGTTAQRTQPDQLARESVDAGVPGVMVRVEVNSLHAKGPSCHADKRA